MWLDCACKQYKEKVNTYICCSLWFINDLPGNSFNFRFQFSRNESCVRACLHQYDANRNMTLPFCRFFRSSPSSSSRKTWSIFLQRRNAITATTTKKTQRYSIEFFITIIAFDWPQLWHDQKHMRWWRQGCCCCCWYLVRMEILPGFDFVRSTLSAQAKERSPFYSLTRFHFRQKKKNKRTEKINDSCYIGKMTAQKMMRCDPILDPLFLMQLQLYVFRMVSSRCHKNVCPSWIHSTIARTTIENSRETASISSWLIIFWREMEPETKLFTYTDSVRCARYAKTKSGQFDIVQVFIQWIFYQMHEHMRQIAI